MTEQYSDQSGIQTTRQQLRQWFAEPLGKSLLELELVKINQILTNLFGYHIVQVGCFEEDSFLNACRISNKYILRLDEDGKCHIKADFVGACDAIPLAGDSIDVMFLPHVLEFTLNPHKLLREVDRVLIGDGHLIISGFNPWSLWGLWRLFLAWREVPPWCGHFFGLARLKDWLSLLDFELLSVERVFFRPPLKHTGVMHKLKFLDKLGRYCWPFWGGAYIILARKRVLPLTQIRMHWRRERKVITPGIVEPSTRM